MHSRREWGRAKTKILQAGLPDSVFFCQSHLAGIIRAHLGNPWLASLQLRGARSLLKDRQADKTPAHFTVQDKIIMFILPKSMPPSVTNLTQRHFFLGILCQFGYLPCLVHRKAAPLELTSVPLDARKCEASFSLITLNTKPNILIWHNHP